MSRGQVKPCNDQSRNDMFSFVSTLAAVNRGRRSASTCNASEWRNDQGELVNFRIKFENPKKIERDWDVLELIRDRIVSIKDDIRLIVEVRDPRVPQSSYSRLFDLWRRELGTESMVVYTKAEMINEKEKDRLRKFTMEQMDIPSENIFFEDLRMVRRLRTPDRAEMVSKMKRLALTQGAPSRGQSFKIMVAGVPNAGKSSVVYVSTRTITKNRKRKGLYNLPPVGFQIGVTKDVGKNWLNINPDLVLLDMPGVLTESHTGEEDPLVPYKLATVLCLSLARFQNDAGVTVKEVADFLLFTLNRARKFEYTRHYNLVLPTDDIDELFKYVPGPTDEQKAQRFLRDFQLNRMGFVILDDIPEVETDRPDDEDPESYLEEVERKFQEIKKRSRFERERQRRTLMWKDEKKPPRADTTRDPSNDEWFPV
eukprot:Plantae.Rhodophyta-Purpureofilum_apyrenoidigerum.ctg6396.p1 GENE.Plantae.Rhodophyta-Purpureofilum_apyrenoidigerum.ctg6396~~Plantae.Rhodophyta-Purpureofilum_apyrenoidigerum.ctg6396.p1  ORF type:complete len:425 (-),score=85.15 Plantae.Rhodophyta-Purpureofilum_apyrenoidigerum.ctg6396:1176-2450(-)